jgi:hypothetical protein
MCRIDRGLADPPNAQRDKRAQKFFRFGDIRGDVVIDKEKQLSQGLERSDL